MCHEFSSERNNGLPARRLIAIRGRLGFDCPWFCLISLLCFFPLYHEIKRWGATFCYWPHTHCSFLLIDLSCCVDHVPSVWRIPFIIFSPQCTFVRSTLSVIYMTAYLFHASVWRIHVAGYKALDWQWFYSALWKCYPLVFWPLLFIGSWLRNITTCIILLSMFLDYSSFKYSGVWV